MRVDRCTMGIMRAHIYIEMSATISPADRLLSVQLKLRRLVEEALQRELDNPSHLMPDIEPVTDVNLCIDPEDDACYVEDE